MYTSYKFNIDAKSSYCIGDSHGNWGLLKYKIRESGIKDAVLIVAGDCGFGFEKEGYYKQQYNSMKKVLKGQNVTVVFVRGNHDDPKYFDGEKINFEFWKAVPDYSVISLNDNHNILCVGGAISVDRFQRIIEDNKNANRYGSNIKSYWEDEFPVYKAEILDKINEYGISVNTVITHSSPNFAPLTDKNGIQTFITYDKDLIKDIDRERLVMTQIYDHLIKKDKHPVKLWVHGHFHQHSLFYSDEDVKIIMLDCLERRNNSWDIYPIER